MKRAKFFAASFAFALILVFLNTSVASAGWVNGYSKSDGTYVNGYWRSDPNGLKYDNYSFDGDWSDAFNDSYYAPTKNYSSDWYTPAWVTQDDYYVGKSFFDSRNSYTTYDSSTYDYDYDFWDDPIYNYTPSYNYGYNYLDSVNTYKSDYFDYDGYTSTYTTPSYNSYNSYTSPTYNSYTTPSYYDTYNSYTTPSNNSYTTPSYNSYTSPSYYNSYDDGSTCYSYYSC